MRPLLPLIFLVIALSADARRSRIDSALVQLQSGLTDSQRVRTLFQLGRDYLNINSDSSVFFLHETVRLAAKTGQHRSEAEAYALLGVHEKNKGNYENALQFHLRALKIKEENHDEPVLATTYNDIGVLYKTMGRFQEALVYYKKSNELCRRLGIQKGIAMTYNNIGTIHRELTGLDSALYYYQKALQEAERTSDPYSISVCLTNVGDIYVDQQRYTEALAMFGRSLAIDRAAEDMTGMASGYNSMARTYSAMKQYPQALAYSDSALATVLKTDLRQDRLTTLMLRAGILEGKGDVGHAVDAMRNYIALKDSLMNEETHRQISELQTKYETSKKEQQIARQQAQLREKNLTILGIAVVVALLALLAMSYYRRNKLKQQAVLQKTVLQQQEMATRAVIEAEERERRRIASDLHDGVGQLMSAAKMNLSLIGSELEFNDPVQQENFSKAVALVDEGCREVRTVSHNIMPNALLKAGLTTAIREFINKIDQRVLKVNLYTEGLNERLAGNIESVLYRIIQECINNVIRHSSASQLDIAIIRDETEITVTIEDNGCGFDLSDRTLSEGIGMKNIQSRVDYLAGSIEWDTAPGKGTVVMIHVPAKTAP